MTSRQSDSVSKIDPSLLLSGTPRAGDAMWQVAAAVCVLCVSSLAVFSIHLRNQLLIRVAALSSPKNPLPSPDIGKVPPSPASSIPIETSIKGRKYSTLDVTDGSALSRDLNVADFTGKADVLFLRSGSDPTEINPTSPLSKLMRENGLVPEETRSREVPTNQGHGWSSWIECQISAPKGYTLVLARFNVVGSRTCGNDAECKVVERTSRTLRYQFRVWRRKESSSSHEVLGYGTGPSGRISGAVLSTPGTSVGVITALYKPSHKR